MSDLIDFIFDLFPWIVGITIISLFFISKDLKIKNDRHITYEYYLKYKLPNDDKYLVAHVDDFDEITKRTDNFLLWDFHNGNTLDSETSIKILNSDDSEVMLGLGENVQIWYTPKH